MKLTRTLLLFIFLSIFAFANPTNKPPAHAFDIVSIFLKNGINIDSQAIEELLVASITANMNIEPQFLEVAFYDTRTNEALSRERVRELIGPIRQDGAFAMLQMAEQIAPNGLPMDRERIMALLDAAFIASMRNPPKHINVEFYDKRCGPTKQGGGISGSVPTQRCQPQTTKWGDIDIASVKKFPLKDLPQTAKDFKKKFQTYKQEIPKHLKEYTKENVVISGKNEEELIQEILTIKEKFSKNSQKIVDYKMLESEIYDNEILFMYGYIFY